MPLEFASIDKKKVSFFRFKKINDRYLLTNEIGEYCFLDNQQFDLFISGKLKEEKYPALYQELRDKSFIRDNLDVNDLSNKYISKNKFLSNGPSLHIIVVTLRCDHKCLYCQAGASGLKEKHLDMDIYTAEKTVDRIFECPDSNICIEFQGGEPLVNWNVVRFIIEYAQKKNKTVKKKILFSLVSNFSFMSDEQLDFLVKNNITICTSLDGPEIIHNKNRTTIRRSNSYINTINWLKKIKKRIKKNKTYKYNINALTTVTKSSLSCPESIIDEFVSLGLEEIHLRPVAPFGLNKSAWSRVAFSAEDFIDFYRRALDYIVELNIKGKKIRERTAAIFLTKILFNNDPNYLDIRSPCGAGIGQLAYNFNGNVYSCDEGRMLSVIGDKSFLLGNIKKNSYEQIIDNEVVKTMCIASCLDGLPVCSECVYKPYCGVCPIYNYVVEGNIFSQMFNNERCKIYQGILDYIFKGLENKKNKEIFLKWVEKKS